MKGNLQRKDGENGLTFGVGEAETIFAGIGKETNRLLLF